jgi:hypothetical protein
MIAAGFAFVHLREAPPAEPPMVRFQRPVKFKTETRTNLHFGGSKVDGL